MILPYKPVHTEEWLTKYLKANYYTKKYDRFMWWRSYTLRNNPLSNKHPLRDRILNGDFELGSFVFEIEMVEHRMNEKFKSIGHDDVQYHEAIQIDKARRKRLQEDRDRDERIKLEDIKKYFVLEFRMTKEQYDRESMKPNRDLISFYYKMEDKFGKRAILSSFKPKGLRLANERSK